METMFVMLMMLFWTLVILIVIVIVLGISTSLKLNKILIELESTKIDLSFHYQNILEEIVSFDNLRLEIKKSSDFVEKSIDQLRVSIVGGTPAKDERRWDSLKNAFKQQPKSVNE